MKRWPRFLRPRRIPDVRELDRAALGDLPRLENNRGRGPAALVWMALCSHLHWGTRWRSVYVSNGRLADETGLSRRMVSYALAYLKRVGRIRARYGKRGRYGWGRILQLRMPPGGAPRVVLPKAAEVSEIWRRCKREAGDHSVLAAVTLAVAAYVHARCEHRRIGRAKACETTIATLARFVGSPRGGSFNRRLAFLERCQLVVRKGETWRGGFILVAKFVVTSLRLLAGTAEAVIRERLADPRFCRVTDPRGLANMSRALAVGME